MTASLDTPRTPADWAAYYQLRYQVLRQPWQQPPGSERAADDDAPTTTHVLWRAPDGAVAGVARLHPSGPGQGQVRYMAVSPAWQGHHVGRQLLDYLEAAARQQGLTEIVLHARQSAVGFYERLGYAVVEPSHTLFGTVPHFLMRKAL
ncbi:GNAT family N-acetyltransferase [Hymenobacter sp. 15J16-1T3B]|uniref:GNAT family N-acetyltransferase n=1 Tax=Hymenobacter sp. 15J16-1T3B TaxID=2886941 RepID=UPI001D11B892|nr:GNAT family N-acetyltransferase [Hymenobacter sp. 15J16-1T3B]MCC3159919.1 GNAT family N-acetyltransferase [Hymenobacter sp. 15J16-1T3B]